MTPPPFKGLKLSNRTTKLAVYALYALFIVLSLATVGSAKDKLVTILAIAGIWAFGFALVYISNHIHTIIIYVKTIHSFHKELDEINKSPSDNLQEKLLSPQEAAAFEQITQRYFLAE